jgi:hypothetical protein
MKVIEQNGIFKASRIAGPKHNYLGIRFSDRECDAQIMARTIGEDSAVTVEGAEVLEIVRKAVESEAVNEDRSLYVSLIEFVPTDTFDEQAYRELATVITRHVLKEGRCLQE